MGIVNYIQENNLGPELKKRKNYTMKELQNSLDNEAVIDVHVIKCTKDLTLIVRLNNSLVGEIAFEDTMLAKQGKIKKLNVMHLVGKTIKCVVTEITAKKPGEYKVKLSRKKAQERYKEEVLHKILPGTILKGRIAGSEKYGIFVDIGCGIIGLIRAELLGVSRLTEDELKKIFDSGEIIDIIIKDIEDGQISLSYKELLGTWQQNIEYYDIAVGTTIVGKVRNEEDYGLFVELAPNLNGLAEKRDDIKTGDSVTVFVKNILPEKLKIKLMIVSKLDDNEYSNNFRNKLIDDSVERIGRWNYSGETSSKVVETIFKDQFSSEFGE